MTTALALGGLACAPSPHTPASTPSDIDPDVPASTPSTEASDDASTTLATTQDTTGTSSDTGDTGTQPERPPSVPAIFTRRPVACDTPTHRDALGPLVVTPLGAHPVSTRHVWGGGLAGADFDGDGLAEVAIATEAGLERREWSGSTLALSGDFGTADLTMAVGATPADVDGDGDLDLLVTRWNARNRLLRNDDGSFVDMTETSGLLDESLFSISASFADADGDGDLDLAVGNYGETPWHGLTQGHPSRLYLNHGDGTFEEASEQLAGWGDGWTFLLAWQDLDRDFRPELLVLNDNAAVAPSRLLRNHGGVFTAELEAGFFPNYDSMGQGVGDVNQDGTPDFIQTTFAWPELRESEPGNSALGRQWIDVAPARGLVHDSSLGQFFGWGVELIDLDHDGDLDVPMVYGFWDRFPVTAHDQPEEDWSVDALFTQTDGQWVDEAREWGFDSPAAGRGLLVMDVTGDGWLDLVKRQLDAPDLLYRSRCGAEAWLRVRLTMPGANTHAVGAEVRVVTAGVTRTRWISAGSTSLFTGAPPEAWFGLGDATEAQLHIVWPDGTESHQSVETRAYIHVQRE